MIKLKVKKKITRKNFKRKFIWKNNVYCFYQAAMRHYKVLYHASYGLADADTLRQNTSYAHPSFLSFLWTDNYKSVHFLKLLLIQGTIK